MRLLTIAMIGGAIGTGARHLVYIGLLRTTGLTTPWATLTVNIVGSFLMGFLVEMIIRRFDASVEMRTFLATGILGGLTTFSAFSLDIARLLDRGATAPAIGYVIASVAISLIALYVGLALAKTIFA